VGQKKFVMYFEVWAVNRILECRLHESRFVQGLMFDMVMSRITAPESETHDSRRLDLGIRPQSVQHSPQSRHCKFDLLGNILHQSHSNSWREFA
jgi:hypothetical protein